jgi:hypothetical protein
VQFWLIFRALPRARHPSEDQANSLAEAVPWPQPLPFSLSGT